MTFCTTIGIVLLHVTVQIIISNGIWTVRALQGQLVQQQKYERIITDISDVYNGVPVDFRYNESQSNSSVSSQEGMASVPGCPKSIQGYPWVYYGTPKKCYLAGEQGPCSNDQKLFIESGSQYGFCNCECFEGMKLVVGQHEFCNSFTVPGEEYAFIPQRRKCYALYDQGPCKLNQWLVKSVDKNNKTMAVCKTRQCPSGQRPYYDESNNSSKNFTCFAPIGSYAGPVSILPNDCQDGTKYSELLRKCVKKFSFNIG